MNAVAIIPAVLPKDEAELLGYLELVRGVAREIHLDVCDGKFTPEASWPYDTEEGLKKFLIDSEKEEGLPYWQDFDFEVHLMVKNPEALFQKWFSAGATRIIIHIEAIRSIESIAEFLAGRAELGVAINLETPIGELAKYANKINFVHLMSIEDLGYQGSEFDERIFDRIKEVRDLYPGLEISVDGGVGLENAKFLVKSGANRLVVGSAVFGSGLPRDNYAKIVEEVEMK